MKRTYKRRTQVNIEMTEDQRNHLKAKASLHGVSMTTLIKRALDNYNSLTPPTSLAEAITGFCRPCDEVKEALDGKCVTCGEWTMEN
jgi:hypothetical protein